MEINQFFNQKKVFYVICKTDPFVLLAISPYIQNENNILYWWDTIKVRCLEIKTIQMIGNEKVELVDHEDTPYTMLPLTLAIYNKHVKNNLIGKETFTSEDELLKAFT